MGNNADDSATYPSAQRWMGHGEQNQKERIEDEGHAFAETTNRQIITGDVRMITGEISVIKLAWIIN